MKRLVGEFGGKIEELKRTARKKAEEAVRTLSEPKGSKWNKAAAYITLGVIVLAGGGAYIYTKNKKSNAKVA